MDLHIAVIDDRIEDIDTVVSMTKQYLNNNQELKISISSFYSGESFLKQFSANMFHAVFVDICMDGMNGIELSRRLRLLDSKVAIIFMSTTKEFVFETFKVTPFGYLIKPYTFEQFSEVMDKIFSSFFTAKKTIKIKIPHSEILIEKDSIFSALSSGHNTELKTISGKIIRSVDSFACFQKNLLCEENFIECNRGIIVNMDLVLTVKNNDIVMQDGSLYPIRVRNKKDISTKITRYLSQKLKGELYL